MEFDFVKEWFERGNNEKNDIYRFFCYFIAFNWLYNHQSEKEEHMRIISYIGQLEKETDIFSNFDSRSLQSANVKDERNGRVKRYIEEESNPLISSFLNIYQVRCNLFHGSKSMRVPRNEKLIQNSCTVLKEFLERRIQHGIPKDFVGGN